MENTMLMRAEAIAEEARKTLAEAQRVNAETKRLAKRADEEVEEAMRNRAILEEAERALRLRELDKLEFYCKGRGFNYKREDEWVSDMRERHLIIVYDENQNRLWDAACSPGTYGYEQGKLEIFGSIVFEDDPDGAEGVVGWLMANEVIERIERKEGKL